MKRKVFRVALALLFLGMILVSPGSYGLAQREQQYGPVSGQIVHRQPTERLLPYFEAGIQPNNFDAQVRFYNPYSTSVNPMRDPWDVGLSFRGSDDGAYVVTLDTSKQLEIFVVSSDNLDAGPSNSTASLIVHLIANDVDLSANGSNILRVLVEGSDLRVYINGESFGPFEVSTITRPGRIRLWAGVKNAPDGRTGNFKPGAVTRFDNFTVTSLDVQSTPTPQPATGQNSGRPEPPPGRPNLTPPYAISEGEKQVTITGDYGTFSHQDHIETGTYNQYYSLDFGNGGSFSVVAAAGGKLTRHDEPGLQAGSCGAQAITVFIDHGNGWKTVYKHLSSVTVKGQIIKNGVTVDVPVSQGEEIGKSGCTGALAPHLHFELRADYTKCAQPYTSGCTWTYSIDDVRGTPQPRTDPGAHTFKETGHHATSQMMRVWLGGRSIEDSIYINGYPISDARFEVSNTDGKTYLTQWFERARLELHPENQPPFDVLLGLLGAVAAKDRQDEAPFKPVPNPRPVYQTFSLTIPATRPAQQPTQLQWFPETQHTLGDASEGGQTIASFWTQLGGLSQFGFPLSQPFVEVSKDDGSPYLVQYFERQRFEYHPENEGTRYEVLLGRLGAEQAGGSPSPGQAQPTPTSNAPTMLYGPVSKELALTSDGGGSHSTGVFVKDFITQVTLINPYSLSERDMWFTLASISYLSSVSIHIGVGRAGATWECSVYHDSEIKVLATGSANQIHTAANAPNTLRMSVINNTSTATLNGQDLGGCSLPEGIGGGEITLVLAGAPNGTVRFEDFTIWAADK